MSERVLSPAQEDPFVAGLSQALGGPRGAHAVPETPKRRGQFFTAARIVLALTCLMLVAHWVQKSPCQDGAWQNLSQYKNFCYTDVLALYYAEGLNQGKIPYIPETPVPDEHHVEYPVLTGVFMGALGLPVHWLGQQNPINEGQWFYNLNFLVLGAFAVATVAMILSMRRRRPWDAAMFALSPALLVTATVNWDLLAIVLAVGAMYSWAKNRPIVAGILFGLGTSAKLWPLFLIGPLVLLCIRNRRFADMAKTVGVTVLTWLAVNVPVMLISFDDWYEFMDLSSRRAIDWGTSWYIGRFFDTDMFGGGFASLWGDIDAINTWSYAMFGLGCVGVALLIFKAPVPPRFAQVAFLVIAIFLITSKVWSQQFNLWLLPLIVLARPKWTAFLVWQLAEVCYFIAFYGELMGASNSPVFPEKVFIFASMFRLLTVVALIVLVTWEILRPDLDVVRQTYLDDPDNPEDAGARPRPSPEETSQAGQPELVRSGR
jgi:uncharacterized membrane protein